MNGKCERLLQKPQAEACGYRRTSELRLIRESRVLIRQQVQSRYLHRYGFLFSVCGRRMPGIDFRELRRLVSMAEVLAILGFEARRSSGNQLRGSCPLHGSADRSRVFSVNLVKNTFQCFKCGAAGNHLDLWAAATKKPLYEAALELCQRLNRDIPYLQQQQRRGTRN